MSLAMSSLNCYIYMATFRTEKRAETRISAGLRLDHGIKVRASDRPMTLPDKEPVLRVVPMPADVNQHGDKIGRAHV